MIIFLAQLILVVCVALVLKGKLDRLLINVAIEEILAGLFIIDGPKKNRAVAQRHFVVITHRKISEIDRERILKAITKTTPGNPVPQFEINRKILGGIMVKDEEKILDYSLRKRLEMAFNER